MKIKVNGQEKEVNALFAAVCNGSQIGGGIRICPSAQVGDGKLELVVVPQMNVFGIIHAFALLMQGKIFKLKKAEHYYCEEVEIIPDRLRTVQLDGQLYEGQSKFVCKLAQGLQMYRKE